MHFCSKMIVKICRLAHKESKRILSQMASVSSFSPADVLKVIFWFTAVYVSLSKLALFTPVCYYNKIFGA